MSEQRRIFVFVYDGFEMLNLSGPSAVFTTANVLGAVPRYEVSAVSPTGGPVSDSAGLCVLTQSIEDVRPRSPDTVLVAGAEWEPLMRAARNETALRWLRYAAETAGRHGSVCAGAFLLGAAGLLDGRRVATHWEACHQLHGMHPQATVESDALYVVDGRLWTSAGATAGIDMALAMTGQDHGPALKPRIAKRLVMYAHRPGNQTQFGTVLQAQVSSEGRFSQLVSWVEENLSRPIRIRDMAEVAGMSERTFHRKFVSAFGVTPSKYLETCRLEQAKQLLEARMPVGTVAVSVGFRSEAAFRTAFRDRFGVPPSVHTALHAHENSGTGRSGQVPEIRRHNRRA